MEDTVKPETPRQDSPSARSAAVQRLEDQLRCVCDQVVHLTGRLQGTETALVQTRKMKPVPSKETQKAVGDVPVAGENGEDEFESSDLLRWLQDSIKAQLSSMESKLDRLASQLQGYNDRVLTIARETPAIRRATHMRHNRTSVAPRRRTTIIGDSEALRRRTTIIRKSQEKSNDLLAASLPRPEGWPEPYKISPASAVRTSDNKTPSRPSEGSVSFEEQQSMFGAPERVRFQSRGADNSLSLPTASWNQSQSQQSQEMSFAPASSVAQRMMQQAKQESGKATRSNDRAGFSVHSTFTDLRQSIVGVESITERRRRLSKNGELLWNTLEDPGSSKIAQIYDKVMPFFIMMSVLVPVVQSIGPNSPLQGWGGALLETVFETVFLSEINLRFVVRPSTCAFFLNSYNIIDMLSCIPLCLRVPLYVSNRAFELPEDERDSAVGSILLCVVPVLRLLKTLRRFEKFHLLLRALEIAFEALPILIFTFVVITLVFSSCIYLVESRDNVESLPKAMWLTIVTMTTVGYGDTVPQSTEGCLIVGVLVVCSVLYMAMPIGIIGQAFTEVWGDRYRILLARRTANRLLAWGYTAQDIPLLFRSFDSDGNGELDLEEFRQMMQEMKIGLSDRHVVEIFERFDCNGDGTIDDAEFMRALFPTKWHEVYGGKQWRMLEEGEDYIDSQTLEQFKEMGRVDRGTFRPPMGKMSISSDVEGLAEDYRKQMGISDSTCNGEKK